jgi:predicted MPP superfamily phosphohydrolase
MNADSSKLLIIQVSDIHLKKDENIATKRIGNIAKAVANVEVDLKAAIIALSGDVAYSGAQDEYAVAKVCINTLKTELEAKLRNVPVFVLGVPGNHDCNFKEEKSARSILIDSIAKDPARTIGVDVLAQCTAVQANFYKFLDAVQSPARVQNVGEAYYEFEIPIGELSILFRCYNTALGSVLHEKPGNLAIPHVILNTPKPDRVSDYVVSIFHHPYNWLSQFNVRMFRKHIDATSDLILTGHEHDADNYAKYTRRGESMMYLEGAAFQEEGSADYSGFNAIWVDLGAQQQKVITFGWNESLFEPTTANPKWQPFRRSSRLVARDFQLTEAMEQELDDPGAKFTHPTKPNLALDDIYVFPDARVVMMDDKKKHLREENVESKDLLKFISNRRRLLVVGKERAGKSSLAKILFRDSYEKGFVPILIKGDQITSLEREKFEELAERQFLNQYQNPKLPAFNQLDRDQTVIIIDDFDHVRFAPKGRQKILSNIHKRFERIVIFSDDAIRLEEVADADFAAAVLSEYTQLELKDFGYFLRSKLIEKWCRLGAEYAITEHDLECKITRYESLIDTALQKSYLPSIPFFVLIFIQSVDASQPVSASAGSYGHLCELLISRNLATAHKAATLNTKKTYLTELAYHLFTHKARELTEEEFSIFHQKHCQKFNLNLDREAVFHELQEAAILTLLDEHYRFKYLYFQNYFIALFMRDHLEEPAVKQQVGELCKKLHKEDGANIWLFLSHHSKNPILVEMILSHAKTLFKNTNVPKFEEDLGFFKKISDTIPSIMLENRSPEQLREERRRQLDAHHRDEKEITDEEFEQSDFMRFVAQLNDAIKTLDVMGQIVKNFSGSLVGAVKFQLVDECYRLGLRIAGVVLDLWKDDPEKVVNEMVDVILDSMKDDDELKKITRQELADLVRGMFFFMTEATTFGLLKRISHAVGAVELVPTYREVLDANPVNSFKLVDMSVKLDTLKLPTKEVVNLNSELKGNILGTRLLKRLVVNHIYLFPTDYKTKQQICQSLDIPINQARGIDVAYEEQKRLPGVKS